MNCITKLVLLVAIGSSCSKAAPIGYRVRFETVELHPSANRNDFLELRLSISSGDAETVRSIYQFLPHQQTLGRAVYISPLEFLADRTTVTLTLDAYGFGGTDAPALTCASEAVELATTREGMFEFSSNGTSQRFGGEIADGRLHFSVEQFSIGSSARSYHVRFNEAHFLATSGRKDKAPASACLTVASSLDGAGLARIHWKGVARRSQGDRLTDIPPLGRVRLSNGLHLESGSERELRFRVEGITIVDGIAREVLPLLSPAIFLRDEPVTGFINFISEMENDRLQHYKGKVDGYRVADFRAIPDESERPSPPGTITGYISYTVHPYQERH